MKSLIRTLCTWCLLGISAEAALPESGSYSGFMLVTKRIFGFPVKTSVRAFAQISEDGTLKIVLQTTPSLVVNASPDIALETKIEADGSCVVPQAPKIPVLPSPTPPPGGGISLQPLTPVYLGFVQASGSIFTLAYDDLAEYYVYPDGRRAVINHFVAPSPTAWYKFSFRKMTP